METLNYAFILENDSVIPYSILIYFGDKDKYIEEIFSYEDVTLSDVETISQGLQLDPLGMVTRCRNKIAVYFSFPFNEKSDIENLCVIAHEVHHIAHRILEIRGIGFDEELVSHIIQDIITRILKHEPTI